MSKSCEDKLHTISPYTTEDTGLVVWTYLQTHFYLHDNNNEWKLAMYLHRSGILTGNKLRPRDRKEWNDVIEF